jgi:hypothetical protein
MPSFIVMLSRCWAASQVHSRTCVRSAPARPGGSTAPRLQGRARCSPAQPVTGIVPILGECRAGERKARCQGGGEGGGSRNVHLIGLLGATGVACYTCSIPVNPA